MKKRFSIDKQLKSDYTRHRIKVCYYVMVSKTVYNATLEYYKQFFYYNGHVVMKYFYRGTQKR